MSKLIADGLVGQKLEGVAKHVVEALKPPLGWSRMRHNMEELVVLEKLSEINLAIQMAAQWTVNGDSGRDGDHAR